MRLVLNLRAFDKYPVSDYHLQTPLSVLGCSREQTGKTLLSWAVHLPCLLGEGGNKYTDKVRENTSERNRCYKEKINRTTSTAIWRGKGGQLETGQTGKTPEEVTSELRDVKSP